MRSSRSELSWRLGAGLLLVVVMDAAGQTEASESPSGQAEEIAEWRAERLESLKRPDGWLTLVGLGWLHEGANTCGSDPESDVALPGSAPGRAGVIHLREGEAEFAASPGAGVLAAGETVERTILASDADGEPTVLEVGSVSFYVIRRGERFGVRVKDRSSPVYTDFQGLDYFPVNRDWRFEARFVPYDPPRKVDVPTILGTTEEQLSPGAVVFDLEDDEYRLEAYQGSEEDELFFVFGDETNGHETYGGGRFLYARRESGKAVVDFNKAYNPPCVFTPYATCPLPTPENRLPFAVRAGEKTYGDPAH